jgi:tRNA threonylcarbamoyladenosine biosynthesis protein TsaB
VIVLGFDTATPSTTVALRLTDGRVCEARDDPEPGAHPGHATRLLAMTAELLAGAGVGWSQLDRIAVGVGPGTFTGLRVGIATARGLAQSLSVALVGVSSPRALAAAAASAPFEHVLAVIDARRGQAFAAAYSAVARGSSGQRGSTGQQRATGGSAGGLSELVGAQPLAPEELGSVVTRAEELSGERGRRWLAVGDGAVRFRDHLEMVGVTVPDDASRLHLVDAGVICELGIRSAARAGLEQVVPDYRRRPDAELVSERAGALEGSQA